MNLVWFRNDLRTKDNPVLNSAISSGTTACIYCFNLRQFESNPYGFPKTDSQRARFLIESVGNLRKKLDGNLIVRIGKPEDIIPELIEKHGCTSLLYQKEHTSEEIYVEEQLKNKISRPIHRFTDQLLYHPDDLPFSFDELPDVFTQFRKKLEKFAEVREPVEKPVQLPLEIIGLEPGEIPSIQDLGLKEQQTDHRSVIAFKGGEDEAWKRLEHYFFETDSLRDYKYTRNGLLGANYSSKFSPWLAHGCISARSIYKQVELYEKKVHKNDSTYWMKFELIWRDYFRYSAMKYGNKIFQLGGIQQKDLKKSNDPEIFQKWAEGRTGIPFIDANMRELNQTGFMSNRGRQNVASFLAQNLNFDWRWGAAYFESKLIDYDVCSNWGNWAYNATVGHDPRNRYFNILNQADRYDKKGEYVRQWLPELKHVPTEFIHEPHRMGPDQQKLFEVIIGRDYPEPMIDLEESYQEIQRRGD
ncbi:MAG: DASH family cryptochrome [Balneolaceae bacterium]|nr:MAG: DASH family cryptochrome [Balneolaceae bacterium]